MTTARHGLAVVLGIVLFIPAALAFLVLMGSVGLVTQVWGRAAAKVDKPKVAIPIRGWGRMH